MKIWKLILRLYKNIFKEKEWSRDFENYCLESLSGVLFEETYDTKRELIKIIQSYIEEDFWPEYVLFQSKSVHVANFRNLAIVLVDKLILRNPKKFVFLENYRPHARE